MIEKAQDLQKNTVSELQTEIKSLKGILLNRRGGNVNPTQSVDPSSILSVVPSGQATLPSWQLETVKSGCSDTLSATEE